MDTSETYIKMCEKAEEIQGIVKPHHTVCAAWKLGDFVHFDDAVRVIIKEDNTIRDMTWLPRQDQLQEMVNLTTRNEVLNGTHIIRIMTCFVFSWSFAWR